MPHPTPSCGVVWLCLLIPVCNLVRIHPRTRKHTLTCAPIHTFVHEHNPWQHQTIPPFITICMHAPSSHSTHTCHRARCATGCIPVWRRVSIPLCVPHSLGAVYDPQRAGMCSLLVGGVDRLPLHEFPHQIPVRVHGALLLPPLYPCLHVCMGKIIENSKP